MNTQAMFASGYCRTSNKYGLISRIDREDWQEHMAKHHAPYDPDGAGMAWVNSMRNSGYAGDWYRRCLSKDTLEIGRSKARAFPASMDGPQIYLPKVPS